MYYTSKKVRAKTQKHSGWASIIAHDSPFSADDVAALDKSLVGHVILPSDPGYNDDRMQSNMAFQIYPLLIVHCEVFSDVGKALAFARKHDIWIAARSGGHSTAGYAVNTGMVIDVSGLTWVVVDENAKTAVVGAGTNFAHLATTLNDYGLHVPSGGCPDVCVAGYMQGGGYGFTSRMFGIHCDLVIEVLVMLANGDIVRASKDRNADLFWAVRGGTGNNFGILLQITYRLHELGRLWGFGLKWPLSKAARGLDFLQRHFMGSNRNDKLGFQVLMGFEGEKPCVVMRGMYNGKRKKGLELIDPLRKKTGASLQLDKSGSYLELNDYLLTTPAEIPQVPDLAREDKESCYIAKPLGEKGWQRIVDFYKTTPNPYSLVAMEIYGGRINELPEGENAFIHRDVDMDLFVDVFWMNKQEREAIIPWLDDYMKLVNEYGNGRSYQNYPRRTQQNFLERYFGPYVPALQLVKKKYDPKNVFHYQQSIPCEKPDVKPDCGPLDALALPISDVVSQGGAD